MTNLHVRSVRGPFDDPHLAAAALAALRRADAMGLRSRLTHYFCDVPDGVWAEFLRHEESAAAPDAKGAGGVEGQEDGLGRRRSLGALETRRRPGSHDPGAR